MIQKKLFHFAEALWEDPAEYKVFASDRMLCLNQTFIQQQRPKDRDIRSGLMSGAAFLLSAPGIADRYAFRKKFPRILICEDVMICGRGISGLIEAFYEIVKDRLAAAGITVTENQLNEDMRRTIGIYTFARSRNEEMLIDEARCRILRTQVLPTAELIELIARITSYLRNAEMTQTPYLLSVRLPRYFFASADLNTEPFTYGGKQHYVFLKDRNPYVAETVCICRSKNGKDGILTGIPMFTYIGTQSYNRLCERIAGRIKRDMRHSQAASYLDIDGPALAVPKLQLVTFLYSILCTADFCRKTLNINGTDLYNVLTSRIEMHFINFGDNELFRYEILSLFRYLASPKADTAEFWDILDQAAGKQDIANKDDIRSSFYPISGHGENRERKICEDAEDIFCETEMDSGYDTCRRIRLGTKYNAKEDPGAVSFDHYIRLMKKKGNSREDSVGCLLSLINNGAASMTIKQDSHTIGIALRSSGISSLIFIRMFDMLIPAFAEIEKQCKKTGAYKSDAVENFIEYILQHDHSSSRCFDERDKRIMERLRRKKLLLLCLYSAGQDFTEWNDCLRRCKNVPIPDPASGIFTNSEIQKRENYYLAIAKGQKP